MTYKFGESEWEAPTKKQNTKDSFKDLFLGLKQGDNEVRVVTSPFQYAAHKYKAPGDKGFGKKVVCTGDETCPLCKVGDKAKRKWYLGVIDRASGTYKVLDVSYAIYSGIVAYVTNKRWGDITKYDVNIVVNKNAAPADYYKVMTVPDGKTPLSPEDQKIVDNIDYDQLKKLSTPPTAEQVQKKIDYIHSQLGIAAGVAPKAQEEEKAEAPKPAKGKSKVVVPTADDEEFENFEESD